MALFRKNPAFIGDRPLDCTSCSIRRGINRQDCFFAEEDYRFYPDYLGEYAAKSGCAIHAYVAELALPIDAPPGHRGDRPTIKEMLTPRSDFVDHIFWQREIVGA
jgi:hypothetical protein